MDKLQSPFYFGRYRVTQTDAAGGSLRFSIYGNSGTRLIVTHCSIQGGGFATNRTSDIYLRDQDDNLVLKLASGSLGSGSLFNVPSTGGNATSQNNVSNLSEIPVIQKDKLVFQASGLAQNEYIDINVRGFITGKVPYYSTSGSGGTPSLSVTQNNIN